MKKCKNCFHPTTKPTYNTQVADKLYCGNEESEYFGRPVAPEGSCDNHKPKKEVEIKLSGKLVTAKGNKDELEQQTEKED